MLTGRCAFLHPDGQQCRAWPCQESRYRFWHDPAQAEELADAQRLGGVRRRRERTLAGAYEFGGVRTIEDLVRVVEIVVFEPAAGSSCRP